MKSTIDEMKHVLGFYRGITKEYNVKDKLVFDDVLLLLENVSKHEGIDHELRVMPQINGFKVKYRGNIYDDFEIKRNDVIILNPTGNRIQTSPNKCEIIIDYAA